MPGTGERVRVVTNLPDRLRELRDARGMTRAQLAEAGGVSERAIKEIETGQSARPLYDIFLAIARGLGVSAEELAAPAVAPPARRGPGRPPRS